MPLPLPVRVAAALIAALGSVGCSRDPVSARPVTAAETAAPRALSVPADARPLPVVDDEPAPYRQDSATVPATAARIVEFSAMSGGVSGPAIRQPGSPAPAVTLAAPSAQRSPEVREPGAPPVAAATAPTTVATLPARSEFVPLTAPPPAAMPAATPLPRMPAAPDFNSVAAPPVSPGAQVGPYAMIPPGASPPAAAFQPLAQPAPAVASSPPTFDSPRQPSPSPRQNFNRDGGMQAVAQQAQALADRGLAMAQRGMLFAGRAEMTKALQLLAQALDAQHGANGHAAALASGLVALEEARDFSPPDQQPAAVIDVAAVAQTHRTPLLKHDPAAASLSPVAAQQQYFAFAQQQLVAAAGGQPVASQVLYRLGRLQSALAAHDAAPQALHGPQAMVFHQAALAVDSRNHLAANELGVLLARYGQLDSAKQLLVQSVSLQPQVESWHNLAVVHRRLGESELAQQADRQRELLAQKSGRAAAAGDLVRWVDPRTFAATSAGDVPWPANTAAQATASATGQRR